MSQDALRIGLRLLASLTRHRTPSDDEIRLLERLVGPRPADQELDEWVVAVVQRETALRRAARVQRKSPPSS